MVKAEERGTRLLRLLEYLNEHDGPVAVAELIEFASREFGVSEVTLRSDLATLCALRPAAKLARGMYEAVPAPGRGGLFGSGLFTTRLAHRAEAKLAIASAVVDLLARQADLRVLLLDGGSTTYYVADLLSERRGLDLLVWTSNVAGAARLAGSRGVSVRLLGGQFHPDYAVVYGDETERALRSLAGEGPGESPLPQFPGTHTVLDINALGEDGSLYTDESNERQQKRLMVQLAEEVTVVADAGKLFRRRLGLQPHTVARLEDLAGCRCVRLVSDDGLTGEQAAVAEELFRMRFPEAQVEITRGPSWWAIQAVRTQPTG